MFVLDLTQGAFDLAQFNYIKTLFRNTYGLKIPFVFTKFNNLLNDVMTKLETSGALEDLPFEDVQAQVLADVQKVIQTFKNEIERTFSDVIYFIYDPLTEGYFADSQMNIMTEEQLDNNPSFYDIS